MRTGAHLGAVQVFAALAFGVVEAVDTVESLPSRLADG